MGLSGDPLDAIRDLIYDNWDATSPSKTDLTTAEGAAKIVIGGVPLNMRAPAIAVRTDRKNPKEKAGGPEAWKLYRHYIYVDVYATSDTELYSMEKEVEDILESKRMTPGGGMHHIEFAPDWRPKSHKDSGSRQAIAESMRFCLVYWRIPT